METDQLPQTGSSEKASAPRLLLLSRGPAQTLKLEFVSQWLKNCRGLICKHIDETSQDGKPGIIFSISELTPPTPL